MLVGGLAVLALGFLLGVGYSMAALDGADGAATVGDGWARFAAQQIRRGEEAERSAEARHSEMMQAIRSVQSGRGPADLGASTPGGAPAVSAPTASGRSAASGVIPAERSARLEAFDGWVSDEAFRVRWTGVEAAKLRQWLGPPDSISASATGATWRYRRTLADGTTRTTVVRIADGAVTSVSTE